LRKSNRIIPSNGLLLIEGTLGKTHAPMFAAALSAKGFFARKTSRKPEKGSDKSAGTVTGYSKG
jgi:hypothetical protein